MYDKESFLTKLKEIHLMEEKNKRKKEFNLLKQKTINDEPALTEFLVDFLLEKDSSGYGVEFFDRILILLCITKHWTGELAAKTYRALLLMNSGYANNCDGSPMDQLLRSLLQNPKVSAEIEKVHAEMTEKAEKDLKIEADKREEEFKKALGLNKVTEKTKKSGNKNNNKAKRKNKGLLPADVKIEEGLEPADVESEEGLLPADVEIEEGLLPADVEIEEGLQPADVKIEKLPPETETANTTTPPPNANGSLSTHSSPEFVSKDDLKCFSQIIDELQLKNKQESKEMEKRIKNLEQENKEMKKRMTNLETICSSMQFRETVLGIVDRDDNAEIKKCGKREDLIALKNQLNSIVHESQPMKALRFDRTFVKYKPIIEFICKEYIRDIRCEFIP